MRAVTSLVIFVVLSLAGCGRSAQTSGLNAIALNYVRLAIALGEHDPDGLDYNIAPAAPGPRKAPSLREIVTAANNARTQLASFPEEARSERGRFLSGQLRSVAARAEILLGRNRSFDEESQLLFGFIATPAPPTARRVLPVRFAGGGSPARQIEELQTRGSIPPDRLAAVMTAALNACRGETVRHLILPPGERVSLEFVRNKPWAAYSTYRGNYLSVIQINADFAITPDTALELACHEGYPGHHVFNTLVDEKLLRGEHREELLVQPTFSPQSLVSEATASAIAGLTFAPDERLRIVREILCPLAGLGADDAADQMEVDRLLDSLAMDRFSIARDYVDGKLEFVRAESAFEERALTAHADALLQYINEYRTYVITYTAGRETMRRWMVSRSGGPWSALQQLVSHPVFPADTPVAVGGG